MSSEQPVIESFESSDGVHAVEIFRRPDGTFGFEEYRHDPEDRGVRLVAGEYSALRYDSAAGAQAAAFEAVPWLTADGGSA